VSEVVVAIFREFGAQLALVILLVIAAGITIRVLASRIERLYDKRIDDINVTCTGRIADINAAHAESIRAIREGHANEIAALKIHSEKGWQSAAAFQAQAERLAEKYADSTELARDMADELLERRRTRRTSR
jgi:hypothetical protein